MRKKVFILLLFPLLMFMTTTAWAVSFFAIDNPADGGNTVTLSVSLFSFPDTPGAFSTLQYRIGGSGLWNTYSGVPIPIDTGAPGGNKLVEWKLNDNLAGSRSFSEAGFAPNVYKAVGILWPGGPPVLLTTNSANSSDGGVSPVPIPAAAILFCSGLLLFVGFRKRAN